MSTPHKATPEQWARQEEFAAGSDMLRCLLELRARVEALEAGATCPHIITSDEGTSYCALAEKVAAMESPAPPSGSLVERVQQAIHDIDFPHGTDEARAAIREVATWLRDNPGPNSAWGAVARDLMDEASRG